MKINSSRFGELEVNADSVLTFPNGMAGLENCTRYHLLNNEEGEGTVYYLQSLDDPDLTFSVVDPTLFGINYELKLSDEEAAMLGAKSPDDLGVMLVVYRSEGENTLLKTGVAANINGPLVFNPTTRLGLQKILVGTEVGITLRDAG